MTAVAEVSLATRWHPYLAATLDPFSIGRLGQAGLPPARRCLMLAAGASSVPGWLADRACRAGSVVATDPDVRVVRPHSGVTVASHDWQRLPAGRYGLVWTRLGLAGQRHRDRILPGLAAAVEAGGVLVVEEWHGWLDPPVLAAATAADRRLVDRYLRLMAEQILPGRHIDATWAGRVHAGMRAAGLRQIDTRIDAPVWPAGSPGALALAAQLHRYRPHLLTIAVTVGQVRRLTELLTDPTSGLVVRGHPLFSVMGRQR
jgi:hypothetical protein